MSVRPQFYDIELVEWGAAGYFSVVIKAAAGADEGDSGELKVPYPRTRRKRARAAAAGGAVTRRR